MARAVEVIEVHVLVIPYPARGHNLAAIQLARKFGPYGVRVTLCNIFDNLSAELLGVCETVGITVTNLGVRPAGAGPGNLPFMGDVESLQGETEELVAHLNSDGAAPVACIVSDVFHGWTQSVAEKFGIPRYAICTSLARWLAAFLHMPTLAAQGIVPVQPAEKNEVVHIPGLPPTRRGDLSPAVQASTPYCEHFFGQYVYRCAQPAVAAAGHFVNSFYALEPACIDALRSSGAPVFPVGPLVHDAYLQPPRRASCEEPGAAYLRWLDAQPADSVLFVSFGSVVTLSARQIHELALGLEASKQRFLLVVRDLPLLPESFTAHALGTGFVQSEWVNQLDVLSHPAVGAFLTHCGLNSTLESVCRGVPLLAWPFQADQMLNCRFLVDEVRAAMEVHKGADGFVTRDEVARAVREVMVSESTKANVHRLREKVKEAMDGSVQKSVEAFLENLKNETICVGN